MVEVSGTVKVNGKLVEQGIIKFVPLDGKSRSAGSAIKDGQYTTKVPVGTMKVAINVPRPTGAKRKVSPTGPEIQVTEESLPAKYSSEEETELRMEVTTRMEKDFDLKKD